MRWQGLAVFAVCLFVAADDKKEEAVKKDLKYFQGIWKFESVESDGTKSDPAMFKASRLVIKDDKFSMTEMGMTLKGKFKIDTTTKPKQIDITFEEGPAKGTTIQGIYEVDDDTYKICLTLTPNDRPKEFSSKGAGHILEIMKKVKE